MLTTEHIMTLMLIGVAISGALWLVTEAIVKRTLLGVTKGKFIKLWLPLILGVPIGTVGFPLVYAQVVGPFDVDWRWFALGTFLGVVAGAGSKVAHDLAKTIVAKVGA